MGWRHRTDSGLEDSLRSRRAEARSAFIDSLSARVLAHSRVPGRAWSRLAFAGAVSVFVLGTFASFGGLSYAASGAAGTYDAVKQVAAQHKLLVSVRKSSAADQYRSKPKPRKHHRAGVAGARNAQNAVVRPKGTLPFTGMSLLATMLVSLALIVAGIALRRRERRNT